MSAPDMDVIKEIPGYRVILKAVLKSQIQQLVEQLAATTDEESVILTASVADGTLCHLGSDSGKVFLEDHEDIKSQFLGFCLKRHHKKQQEKERKEAQEREEALARSMQAVTPPRYGNIGPQQGFMSQRSPRYPSPRQQGIHPVALAQAGMVRSPHARHQPYPTVRPSRQLSQKLHQNTNSIKPKSEIDTSVVKIELDDSSNQSANDTNDIQSPTKTSAQDLNHPGTPSAHPAMSSGSQSPCASNNDDAKSDTSSSTIPNDTPDLKPVDTGPPGGLSLDSDLSNLISENSGLDTSVQSRTETQGSISELDTSGQLDPDVSVKLEAGTDDSEMDLEITGVELGQRLPHEQMNSQEWLASVQNVMQGASGSSADMGDQQSYNYEDNEHSFEDNHNEEDKCVDGGIGITGNRLIPREPGYKSVSASSASGIKRYDCHVCGRMFNHSGHRNEHVRIHYGVKPWKCEICGKSFSRRNTLHRHALVKHQLFMTS